jgi:hypothetical protein
VFDGVSVFVVSPAECCLWLVVEMFVCVVFPVVDLGCPCFGVVVVKCIPSVVAWIGSCIVPVLDDL